MKMNISLASESGIPQESIGIIKNTRRTSDDMIMIFGNKELATVGGLEFGEITAVGDIAFGFKPVMRT